MKRLLSIIIKNKSVAIFFVFVLITAGVVSFISIPKQETPEFSIPYAMITTVFPGASQADVDSLVTEPIEKTVMQTEGYKSVISYSSNSLSLVIVELKFSADRKHSFDEMEASLRELEGSLPDGCGQIKVNRNITDTAGIMVSLSSKSQDADELAAGAQTVIDKLSEIDGLERFEVNGEKDEIVRITVDNKKMVSTGLTLSDISKLVEAGNMDIPVGEIESDSEKSAIDYTGAFKTPSDIENIKIGFSPELGRILNLGDIADVNLTEEYSSARYYHNGIPTVIISGYFENGINTLPLKDEINEKLDEAGDELPGMDISLIISQPGEISDSLGTFSMNLLISIGLVIFVILIGMGFRNSVVVSVSLPFSILLTFSAMYLLGIRIQQISIAALIMSLGMLVDNSIVVSDSIQGELDSGRKLKKSCIKGTRNVSVPVLASTITTIAAFAPFLFLNSIAGDYIKSLPKIISISLSASYITAILVIPLLGYIFFRKRDKQRGERNRRFYAGILKWSMKRKALVWIFTLALLCGSVFLAFNLETVFFPASDKNIVYIDIRSNISDDTGATNEIVKDISKMLDKEDAVIDYTSSVGGGLPRFNQIMYVYTNTPDMGQIMIRIDPDSDDFKNAGEFKEYLQKKIDAENLPAKITVKQLMYAFPMDEDIRIRINGKNLENLKKLESEVYSILTESDSLTNESKGNTDYTKIYAMDIDGEKAAMQQIVPAEALNEISLAVSGRHITDIVYKGREVPVYITGGLVSYQDVNEYMLRNGQGSYIEAGKVVDLTESSELSTIPRYNGLYSILVTADYESGVDKSKALSSIKDKIAELDMGGASVVYDGEDELIKENFGQIGVIGIIAIAFVFMILLIQFRSFRIPLLIFITIPLSAIGSIAGLYITGQPVSFTALLGIVSLLGIVVNNAIILLDYIKKDMTKGSDAEKACLNAARRRLRPIVLSTSTTVIGLIPLAVGNSQLFKPMAIALMSGLLVSTLLTLVVIPVSASILLKGRKFG